MAHAHDLTGMAFGRLTVSARDLSKKHEKPVWLCHCSCGAETSVRAAALKSGTSQSCGCLRSELMSKRPTTHGKQFTPTYFSWKAMRARCADPSNRYYGAKGIAVCARWNVFLDFLEDMGPRPSGTTLDRIDGELGYEPKNCRWATASEQTANRASYAGERHSEIMRRVAVRGERHPSARLTDDRVLKMQLMHGDGTSYSAAGAVFGVSRQVARYAITGKTWSHLKNKLDGNNG